MCLKLWFESNWHFCNITESGCFLKSIVQKQSSKQSLPQVSLKKVTFQNSIAELWTLTSNQMIPYQLPHTRFDQISDHKHGMYWYERLSTKLLAQEAHKNTKLMFTKTGLFLFFSSMIWEMTVQKNYKQTLPKCKLKSNCPETPYRILEGSF